MKDKKNGHASDRLTGRGEGRQGVDKAPGEETPQDTRQVVQETQKDKKVDGDPREENTGSREQQG